MIYHYNFFLLGWNSNILFRGGYICVDAFFVISGFMCAKVLLSLSRETSFFSWLKRRLMTLYPYYIAALIPAVCTGVFLNGFHGMRRVIAILEELAMIQEWGIINCFPYYNGATWYISAMMFVSCVYFFLSKKFTPKIQAYIIAALSALCFSVIVHKVRAYSCSRRCEASCLAGNNAGLCGNGSRLACLHVQGQYQAEISGGNFRAVCDYACLCLPVHERFIR
ncbi:MAG: acyltransferase family protein [Synergistaceae bacterium]|nr:acyltransferase family protein [Synergistaceae bacterium]